MLLSSRCAPETRELKTQSKLQLDPESQKSQHNVQSHFIFVLNRSFAVLPHIHHICHASPMWQCRCRHVIRCRLLGWLSVMKQSIQDTSRPYHAIDVDATTTTHVVLYSPRSQQRLRLRTARCLSRDNTPLRSFIIVIIGCCCCCHCVPIQRSCLLSNPRTRAVLQTHARASARVLSCSAC